MGRVNIAGLVAGLVLAALATVAHARSGTAPPPGRPTDPETLKAYDVLERHCARCHQSGALKRPKPAADLANLLRLDEVAHDPHLVRPGNPDASRIYTLMLGRRMPYDVHQEGANREPPSPEDIDTLRAWIAGLPPQQPGLCAKRQPVSADAQHIAIARDRAALSGESAVRARYLSLTNLWNECASTAYLDAARRAASVLLNGVVRGARPLTIATLDAGASDRAGETPSGVLLRIDVGDLQWGGLPEALTDWDRLVQLAPDFVADAAQIRNHPARVDWLAFALSEETRKRAGLSSGASDPVRTLLHGVTNGVSGLARLRAFDPPAFRAALAQAGIDPAPVYDQLEMLDVLARRYGRDAGTERVAAELGIEATHLQGRLEFGPPEATSLALRLAQGGVSRSVLETLFRASAAHVHGRTSHDRGETLGISSLARPAGRPWQPSGLELVAAKPRYARDETASLIVRSDVDCHLTLVSVSPVGKAVVLLPNDWDRNTFLPAGKEQAFPRDDSPFRLRLDTAGWETIVAGCNPAGPAFDGIQHDFNLEKFTSLGDYRRFLLRLAEGMPMLTSSVPPGEKRAAAKRQSRPAARSETAQSKVDPVGRTAVRFLVR